MKERYTGLGLFRISLTVIATRMDDTIKSDGQFDEPSWSGYSLQILKHSPRCYSADIL